MHFNLNNLIRETNKKIISNDLDAVLFNYTEDNSIRVSMGEIAYFLDYIKLSEVLSVNDIDLKQEKNVYDTLSKHIINQLMAARGSKAYPEISTHPSDIIK
ncbi:hypothetical protein [Hymenobacter tenuis]